MRVNEVRKTETIEKLVRTEYIAEDGTVFSNEEECKKYEESALFAISKELKRMGNKNYLSHCDINDDCSCDEKVEIFNIQTERDLENLRRYLYLVLKKNGTSDDTVKECFTSKDGTRNKHVFDSVTAGHEVMIFWNYDEDWFWVYNDGSINGYCEFFREKITKLITTETKEETQMLSITFRYAGAMSNWEWRTQHCVVSSVEECKRIYGLDNGDVEYEILEVKEVE